MRKRTLPLGVLLPAGLLVLLASLAALQYRWLGQVSEAEREALSRALDHAARAFADDFDREIGRAYLAFQLSSEPVDIARPETLQRRLSSWQAVSRFPEIVRSLYVASSGDAGQTLLKYDAERNALAGADWPEQFGPVRAQIAPSVSRAPAGGGASERRILTFSTSALVAEVPALVLPLTGRPPGPPGPTAGTPPLERRPADVLFTVAMGHDFLIVELDREHIEQVVLPALAEEHFGDEHAGRYRVSIADGAGRTVLSRGLPDGAAIAEADADASARFFGLRLELARQVSATAFEWRRDAIEEVFAASAAPPPAGAPPAGVSILVGRAVDAQGTFAARLRPSGWRLHVQHSAGSLDAAVAAARTRNLWLSFGILSVLAASVGLIVLNARRSERLAGQQMDFVATVSHELRTPLAVIRSAAQNLSAGVVLDAGQARRYGDLIETEGRRLTDMVEQVLEYAGASANRRSTHVAPVDAGAVARKAAAEAVDACREQGVDLQVDIASDLPLIAADEDALRRAIGNLVTNARKYGADGRWIGVSVARAPGSGRNRSEVRIAVSDRGAGIDPDDLAHVFEPFYRGRYAVERQIHGNGLGLSLVQRIAEAHGGRVSVRSARGDGTTFTLHLPGVEPDRSAEPLGAPVAGEAHRA